MNDVVKMLHQAIEKGEGTQAVTMALQLAPTALLGIGFQVGTEFALQYPEAAGKFLVMMREAENDIAEEVGLPETNRPRVCSRIAADLFSIVEGEDNGN